MSTVTVAGRGRAAQAAQARQKKILIVGAAILAVVLVIQVPRTMNMLKGSETATSAPAPSTPVTPLPTAPGTPAPTSPESAPATLSPDPAAGKLVSFEQFRTKDPFAQQIDQGGSAPAEPAPEAPAASSDGERASSSSEEASGSFTVSSPAAKPAAGGQTAVIKLNGTEQRVAESASFPKGSPVFTLVSVSERSAEIAIANGEFRDGDETISLTVGKPLTLMNTVDGKRYKLLLVSTST